jgi:hypothetical protein
VQIFTFNCNSQRLRRYTSGVIYAGSYPNTVFRFNFNTLDWDSVAKTAVFSCHGNNYRVGLDKNNMCKVPPGVLHEGHFQVSVEGLSAPTNTVRIPVSEKPDGYNPEIPDIDGDTSISGVNILDGGAIISGISDNTPDDTPDNPSDNPGSSDENNVVDYIVNHNIPFYIGLSGKDLSKVAYQQLDANAANYTEQGFYTTTDNTGKITSAGYQMVFDANDENIAQTFAIYSTAKIIAAYQYQPAFNQWLDMGFDGVYWIEDGTTTQMINGKYITYTTYAYNAELMGDAITAPEYWRFEVEVL